MESLETTAIILSLVALIVTVIGFFASLKFYRDGLEMQSRAEKALSKIEERASTIQTQVGGMFDKTLDAALGRTSAQEAKEQQRSMSMRDSVPAPPPAGASPLDALASGTEIAQRVVLFYAFRQLRITNISYADARAIFSLGSDGEFNLLDGERTLIFLGFFVELIPEEIVARTRILFNNLAIAYAGLSDETNESAIRKRAKEILDRISIEILVRDDENKDALAAKVNEFQPAARLIEVTVRTQREVEELVNEEYRRMRL